MSPLISIGRFSVSELRETLTLVRVLASTASSPFPLLAMLRVSTEKRMLARPGPEPASVRIDSKYFWAPLWLTAMFKREKFPFRTLILSSSSVKFPSRLMEFIRTEAISPSSLLSYTKRPPLVMEMFLTLICIGVPPCRVSAATAAVVSALSAMISQLAHPVGET